MWLRRWHTLFLPKNSFYPFEAWHFTTAAIRTKNCKDCFKDFFVPSLILLAVSHTWAWCMWETANLVAGHLACFCAALGLNCCYSRLWQTVHDVALQARKPAIKMCYIWRKHQVKIFFIPCTYFSKIDKLVECWTIST